MSRITREDNVSSAILKMAEGNPGALTTLGNIMNSPEVFSSVKPFKKILMLDSLGIYGSDLWCLGEYVCKGQNMSILNQITQNYTFGRLSREVLMDHIRKQEPFERLYSQEELHLSMKSALAGKGHLFPMLELERHWQLVVEEKYQLKKDSAHCLDIQIQEAVSKTSENKSDRNHHIHLENAELEIE